MTFTIDSELIENNDIRITTSDGGQLEIEHVRNGNTLTFTSDGALIGPDGEEVGSVDKREVQSQSVEWGMF